MNQNQKMESWMGSKESGNEFKVSNRATTCFLWLVGKGKERKEGRRKRRKGKEKGKRMELILHGIKALKYWLWMDRILK